MVYSEEKNNFSGSSNPFEVGKGQELFAHLCPMINSNKE